MALCATRQKADRRRNVSVGVKIVILSVAQKVRNILFHKI